MNAFCETTLQIEDLCLTQIIGTEAKVISTLSMVEIKLTQVFIQQDQI